MTNSSHCRLCAEIKLSTDLLETNTDSVTSNNLDYKIYQCFQIHIEVDDKLPKGVCSNCCDQVMRTHEFNEKVHKAQDILRRIYIQLEDKEEKSNWNPTEQQQNNIEPLVKIEEKEDFDGDFLSTFNNSNNSESDAKNDIPCKQLVTESDSKTKRFKKIKRNKNTKTKSKEIRTVNVVCEQCGKLFKTKRLLTRHMQVHVVGQPYSCDQCDKRFKWVRGLSKHKKSIHSGVTYSCDICGRILNSITTLNKHKLTHSSDFPHVCSYCNKGFKIKYGLKVHLRQHTGESPYACLECNHYFTNYSNFIKHLKGRHRLKNFSIANNHVYPFVNPIKTR